VGSIFRTADAASVSCIILSGYTPGPVDRFSRERKDFVKVSLGAEKSVPYSFVKQIGPVLKKLKREGLYIVAVEQDTKAISLFDFKIPKHTSVAIVLGNEVRGISKAALKYADSIVEVPMRGKKESLNVSVAAGIALFTILKNKELRSRKLSLYPS
jgi:tRNA G18 (ribose-2'-O)-methylase SpoU